jgi:hypothetical protein
MVGLRRDYRRVGTSALVAVAALWIPMAAAQSGDLWLEAVVEPGPVWVQAQATYRLRFYHAVDVRDLRMTGPDARLADVRPLGGERVYEALRDGRRYRVHERSYAVFPLGSGPLALSGAQVSGRVAALGARSADGRQALQLAAAPQTLRVLPVPAAAGAAPWLPARTLSLSESWSSPAREIRVGQVLRRSIRIEAAGVDAGQIPPLGVLVPGMQVQADTPRLENRLEGGVNVGVREQSFQLVALRAGAQVLPELQLPWWNLNEGALALAHLPAQRWQVETSAGVTAPTESRHAQTVVVLAAPPPERLIEFTRWRPWLLLTSVLGLGAALALAWLRRPGVRAAWRLQLACHRGEAGVLRDALLAQAALIWPLAPPLSLEALAQRWSDPSMRQALGTLERCLYAPRADEPNTAALRAAVHTIQRGSSAFSRSRHLRQLEGGYS